VSNEKNTYHYKQLKVWQKAMKLVIHVYKATKNFPEHEQYGLISQMRRSVYLHTFQYCGRCGRNSDKVGNRSRFTVIGSRLKKPKN